MCGCFLKSDCIFDLKRRMSWLSVDDLWYIALRWWPPPVKRHHHRIQTPAHMSESKGWTETWDPGSEYRRTSRNGGWAVSVNRDSSYCATLVATSRWGAPRRTQTPDRMLKSKGWTGAWDPGSERRRGATQTNGEPLINPPHVTLL